MEAATKINSAVKTQPAMNTNKPTTNNVVSEAESFRNALKELDTGVEKAVPEAKTAEVNTVAAESVKQESSQAAPKEQNNVLNQEFKNDGFKTANAPVQNAEQPQEALLQASQKIQDSALMLAQKQEEIQKNLLVGEALSANSQFNENEKLEKTERRNNVQNLIQDKLLNAEEEVSVLPKNPVKENLVNQKAEQEFVKPLVIEDISLKQNEKQVNNKLVKDSLIQEQDAVQNKFAVKDFVELEIEKPVNQKEILPQASQMIKEIQDLSQTPKLVKDSKIVEAKISKEHKLPKIEKQEDKIQVLDESLKVVSAEKLSDGVEDKLEVMLNNQTEVKSTLIAGLESSFLPDNKSAMQTLSDLNSKISAINSISSVSATKAKTDSIKMSKEDANFFVKMVENQNNNTYQANITVNTTNNTVNMEDAKSQQLQSSASVSQALIEKLKESMNTNKPFRVDFDNDIAVIMKVDSNGVLSANFIPGSSAVEQYLRNNIAELRQAFENKNLEYNELSYSGRKQNQQKQQRNNKGGRDE